MYPFGRADEKLIIRLKTRDIQTIFSQWEHEKGGFRIKWVDDVNALIVFQDATVGKLPTS